MKTEEPLMKAQAGAYALVMATQAGHLGVESRPGFRQD